MVSGHTTGQDQHGGQGWAALFLAGRGSLPEPDHWGRPLSAAAGQPCTEMVPQTLLNLRRLQAHR